MIQINYENRFEPGDTVYFMKDNSIVPGIVMSIYLEKTIPRNEIQGLDYLKVIYNVTDGIHTHNKKQEELFHTADEVARDLLVKLEKGF